LRAGEPPHCGQSAAAEIATTMSTASVGSE